MYNISQDVWYLAPDLNEERENASSCELGEFIYTFGGLKSQAGYQLNSIERLNAKLLTSGYENVRWEMLQIK